MKRPQIRTIVPHAASDQHLQSQSDRIADLRVQVIARKLTQSNLTAAQKIAVIDQIVENLKSSGASGVNG